MKEFCDLGFAKLDLDRTKRRGFAEVIYSPGKSREQLNNIVHRLYSQKQDILLTKLSQEAADFVRSGFPALNYDPVARMGFFLNKTAPKKKGLVCVVCAGTGDIPVAEETCLTLELLGNKVKRLYDVGVAGIHRLIFNSKILRKADILIVVAGMEGALASVVSGLTRSPVIAVPTSCGYGSNFNGLSALLTMLNSCSPGITVVNIDNGFGAAYFANLINK
jgi:hypothetical protein